jgi:hypothetical protein
VALLRPDDRTQDQAVTAEEWAAWYQAHWAIVALGAIMLASARVAVPDTLTGLIGAVLIALSLWASRSANRGGVDKSG